MDECDNKSSAIFEQYNHMGDLLYELNNALSNLEGRLQPVMSAPNPSPADMAECDKEDSIHSQLFDGLRNYNFRAVEVLHRIRDIEDRLEL